jgi:hypothetical protein
MICRDEGIILKDLDSKWEPSDRSGKWIKLKPDYINTGSDLDVLIIGSFQINILFISSLVYILEIVSFFFFISCFSSLDLYFFIICS